MNMRKKLQESLSVQLLKREMSNASIVADKIYEELEVILYPQYSSTRMLNLMLGNDIYAEFWDKQSVALIQYFDRLLANQRLAKEELSMLVTGVINYVNSRNYEVPGKYYKQQRFGFAVSRSAPAFQKFNTALAEYSKDLLPAKNSLVKAAENLFSVFKQVNAGISELQKNPIAALTFMTIFTAKLAAAQEPNPNGLVGYYKLDGNTQDSSVHQNHAISWGLDSAPDRNGKENAAVSFPGLNNAYAVGNASIFPDAARTVSVWVEADVYPLFKDIDRGGWIFSYGGSPTPGTSWVMGMNEHCITPPNNYFLGTNSNANTLSYVDNKMYGSPQGWVHFAITTHYHTGTKLYLNGELVASSPETYVANTETMGTIFAIGAIVDNTGKFPVGNSNCLVNFRGAMDDLCIWSRALNGTEVEAEYLRNPSSSNVHDSDDQMPDWELALISGAISAVTTVGVIGVAYKCWSCITKRANEVANPAGLDMDADFIDPVAPPSRGGNRGRPDPVITVSSSIVSNSRGRYADPAHPTSPLSSRSNGSSYSSVEDALDNGDNASASVSRTRPSLQR